MDTVLEEITRRVRLISDPDHIILFGSRARGTADSQSDVDLLVIKSGVTSPRQESVRITRALRGLPCSVDVIVATPEQIDRYRGSIGLVYGPALREGRTLYERSPAAR